MLAALIDHTLLKANATSIEIENLCKEAIDYNFFSVCVNPIFVKLCHSYLNSTKIKIASVVGFPLGANLTEVKRLEAIKTIEHGAHEIDMVMSIGYLKMQRFRDVETDIKTCVQAVHPHIVKVIIETGLLTQEEKILSAKLCEAAGAAFVKTCTGFNGGQALTDDVRLIRQTLSQQIKIKASGGIRSFNQAKSLIEAGADRLGTSASINLVIEEIENNKI